MNVACLTSTFRPGHKALLWPNCEAAVKQNGNDGKQGCRKVRVFMQFAERLSPAAFLHGEMGGLDRLPESDLGLGHMEGST
ncbi:hypothetical protein SAMN04489742_0550 [Arthrobacter crystallopoietes]|uniref:Uncharacterized protein n=1 Tax=Crystallibacter crystallopoietes TaxID=37928 RepID=A0A1H0ZT56_9MICC|nr:hypothetical protein AC20117_14540 [Arthrobacter crystallopoietes]SDQ30613.1 hypothetical protein SAMN04489742_0550 [Arthrobacter crystallopoietes]